MIFYFPLKHFKWNKLIFQVHFPAQEKHLVGRNPVPVPLAVLEHHRQGPRARPLRLGFPKMDR